MIPRIAVVTFTPTLLLVAGCALGGDSRGSAAREFEAVTPDDVFAAAIPILRSEFRRLEIDHEARRIVSAPVEFRTAADTGTARDLIGAESEMRRVATFSVGRRGAGALARLRIDVERRDTAHRRVRQYHGSRLSDAPGQTAIERDAATTEAQNTVWTRVRRDRALERALLSELLERFAPPPADVPAQRKPSPGSADE
jgi:hypothetical protein